MFFERVVKTSGPATEYDVVDLRDVVGVAFEARREVGEQCVWFAKETGVCGQAPGHPGEDHHLPDGDDRVDEVPRAVDHAMSGTSLILFKYQEPISYKNYSGLK